VRENGDVCPETADPDTRYFRTEHGKELMMSPTKLHFKDTNPSTGGKLFLELDDDFGIRLSSHGDINIASGSVGVRASGKVNFSAPSRIRFSQSSIFNTVENPILTDAGNKQITNFFTELMK
jgi:hypothetical protein